MRLSPAVIVFAIGLLGAIAGSALEHAPRAARKMLLASGAALLLIALFLVAPEIVLSYGWMRGVFWMAAGFALVWSIDRFVWPLCPTCSHNHDHDACAAPLHGLGLPLIVASGLHSFFDGWSMTTAQESTRSMQLAFLVGVLLHKVFEGIALGAILRASMGSWPRVITGATAAQGMTVIGGVAAMWMASWVDTSWFAAFLGVAGGSFLYLGYHTLEAEWRKRGAPHAHVEPSFR